MVHSTGCSFKWLGFDSHNAHDGSYLTVTPVPGDQMYSFDGTRHVRGAHRYI